MLIVIPDVLTPAEVESVRAWMDSADFVDGRTTAGARAQRVKNNEQVGRNVPQRREIDALILKALGRNGEFNRTAFPLNVRTPLLSRYREGMEYGLHVDDALMGKGAKAMRTDVSVTVFLNQPWDYDGGELEIHSPFGIETVKAPAGAAVTYPSSTLHRVTPVTRGERLAAVTWVESRIRDPWRRETLHDLFRIKRKMSELDAEAEETDLAHRLYSNMLRDWTDR